MSDTSKGEQPDGSTTTSDEGGKKQDQTVTVEQFQALQSTLISVQDSLKEVIKQRDDAKTDKRNLEREKAEKDNNIEALRASFEAEKAEWSTKHSELENKLKVNVLENEVMRELATVSTHPDLAWMILKDSFELSDKDGRLVPVVKNDVRGIKDFAKAKLTELGKEVLVKNERKPGTGTEGNTNSSATVSLAELAKLQNNDQIRAFDSNKQLRDQILNDKKF